MVSVVLWIRKHSHLGVDICLQIVDIVPTFIFLMVWTKRRKMVWDNYFEEKTKWENWVLKNENQKTEECSLLTFSGFIRVDLGCML